VTDAEFLAHHICAASAVGLTEADLSVLLQMSPRCAYGFSRLFPGESPFTPARFRAAVAELEGRPEVTRRNGRWYPAAALRLCARAGCGADISGLRAGAKYCSVACRNRRWRARPVTVAKAQAGMPRSAPGATEVPDRASPGGERGPRGAGRAPSVPKVPGGTQLNLHLSPTAPVGAWRAKRSRRPNPQPRS
jgi:hypothetical protein